MKAGVLARPNIKVMVLAGIILTIIAHLVVNANSPAPIVIHAHPASGPEGNAYLGQLLWQAADGPTPDVYCRISAVYEQRGDVRKALFFLRQADKLP